MNDPIHYAEPTTLLFTHLVIYNRNDGMILVDITNSAGEVIHSFSSPGTFTSSSRLRIRLSGKLTVVKDD